MPAKNLLIAWFNYFTTFFFLKFFAVVIGEPRRKGTSWRGWRKRRDRLTRDHRAFGWTRSDGPSGEYLWVQNSVNSALYTHTQTHTHTHVNHIHTFLFVHLVFEGVELWLEWGMNQALVISLTSKEKRYFSHMSHRLLNFLIFPLTLRYNWNI